ncbi:17713_t:CDS:1, partial [Acaulospora morrowiae]
DDLDRNPVAGQSLLFGKVNYSTKMVSSKRFVEFNFAILNVCVKVDPRTPSIYRYLLATVIHETADQGYRDTSTAPCSSTGSFDQVIRE